MTGIYIITNRHTLKRYVGQSKNIETRLKSHWNSLLKNKHINPYLQSAYNKYGKDAFIETIVECSEVELTAMEQYFIDVWWKTGILYNICRKAEVPPASWGRKYKHSEETRAKMSADRKGRIPWNKGKKMPPGTGAKVSAKNKGRTAWNKSNAWDRVDEIKKDRLAGYTHLMLCKKYKCGSETIGKICLS
jgi:group I intron endonuclease